MNKAELYYGEACRRADEQYKASQHFSTTAIAVLGFAGILLSLTPFAASEWTDYSIYPAVTIGIAFIVITISTVSGLWSRYWEFQPNLSELAKNIESSEYEDEAMVLWAAKWMSDAVATNKRPLRIKALCLRVAYICLSIEALSLITIFSLGVLQPL